MTVPAADQTPATGPSVLDLIDAQVTKNPDGIAAEFQHKSITNRQLQRASMRVAVELYAQGCRPRDKIPLLTSMGLEMVTAVLGILRLGACYCPMDFAAWNESRVRATLESVQSRLVLSTVKTKVPGYKVLNISDLLGENGGADIPLEGLELLRSIRHDLSLSDLIYIIFTSGTTGKPKGVMISHGSAAHLVVQDFPGSMTVYPGSRVLLFFSVAFDGCAGIVFSTLTNGGTLAMASPSDILDVAPSCTTLVMTPSMLANVAPSAQFDQVREIYMGGEAPTAALIEEWTTPSRKVYNSYGPTECTTAVSVAEMKPGGPIILGNLVSGVELILLDENLESEVEEGEICIRGPCLAVGYLNNETLTAERFFMRNGIRHYRTGDLARRSEAGLHFVARTDRLVKNRGFLINLETEVEPALLGFPSVRRASAFLNRGRLIGFVTPETVFVSDLREHLVNRTDAFLVPDLLFAVSEFPLTPNGKVDTRALGERVVLEAETEDETPPSISSDTMDLVREGFAWVFDWPIHNVRPSTSFGELGGNSLRALKLVSFLRRHDLNVSIGEVFTLDSVSAINSAVVPLKANVADSPSEESAAPLTDHQVEILEETAAVPSSNYMFYTMTRDCGKGLTPSRLRGAWEALFRRHPILRAAFDLDQKQQSIQLTVELDWEEFTVSSPDELCAVSDREVQNVWTQLRLASTELCLQPIFRVVHLPGQTIRVNWIIHHVYSDAWSFGIILNDLEIILGEKETELAPAPSFANIAHFLATMTSHEQSRIQAFWSDYNQPSGDLKPITLPAPVSPSAEPWSILKIDSTVKKATLDDVSRLNGVSSASVIYAAWALMLSRYTTSSTVGMKISVSGRSLSHPATESVVGPLNGRCPFITAIDKRVTVSDFLQSVHQNFYRVNDLQWSYPEFRRQLARSEHRNYWFDTQVVVLLDIPVDVGAWKIVEVQKPTAPIWLGVAQKGETLNLRVRYDGSRYAAEGIGEMTEYFVRTLHGFVEASTSRVVGDITA